MSEATQPLRITDPQTIEFLELVRNMTPNTRRLFLPALRAMAERRLARETREAILRYLHATGHPSPERAADALMRCGMRASVERASGAESAP